MIAPIAIATRLPRLRRHDRTSAWVIMLSPGARRLVRCFGQSTECARRRKARAPAAGAAWRHWTARRRSIMSVPAGRVAEWSIAAVLKTVEPRGSGGSNPSPSARNLFNIKGVYADDMRCARRRENSSFSEQEGNPGTFGAKSPEKTPGICSPPVPEKETAIPAGPGSSGYIQSLALRMYARHAARARALGCAS